MMSIGFDKFACAYIKMARECVNVTLSGRSVSVCHYPIAQNIALSDSTYRWCRYFRFW